MQKNATETMGKVLEKLSKVDDYRKSALISDLFGEEAKGAIAPLLTNLGAFNDLMTLAADKNATAGSMLKEYQVRSKTTANQIILFTNNINKLGITIGSVLLPPLNTLLGGLTSVISVISSVASEFPMFTKYVTLFGTAFVGLSVGIAAVKWATLALMATNPLGWIMAIGAGIVMVGTAIYDNWDSVTSFFGTAFTVIGNGFKALGAIVATAFGVIFALSPIGWVTGIVKAFDIVFKQWDSALSFSENFANGMNRVWGAIKTSVLDTIGSITKWISPFIGNIKSALSWLGVLETKSATVTVRNSNNKRGGGATGAQNDNTVRTRSRYRDGRSGAKSNYTDNSKQDIQINVQAAPGQSEEKIAKQVVRQLPRHKRNRSAKLYDGLD